MPSYSADSCPIVLQWRYLPGDAGDDSYFPLLLRLAINIGANGGSLEALSHLWQGECLQFAASLTSRTQQNASVSLPSEYQRASVASVNQAGNRCTLLRMRKRDEVGQWEPREEAVKDASLKRGKPVSAKCFFLATAPLEGRREKCNQ